MHRAPPAHTLQRSYSAGGSRALIYTVDDAQLMQAMNGSGMKGETFKPSQISDLKGPEAPQNYGFTSVVADATKGADGQIDQCAEGFMNFMGGNRTFPVCGVMDDRRHRLINLAKDAAKGAVAFFGLKDWGQQFLNTDDGMYMTGNTQKKIRMALVQNQNGQTQQQQPGQQALPRKFKSKSGVEFDIETFVVEPRATNGGGGGGGSGSGGQQGTSQPTGQKTLHKEDSTIWFQQDSTQAQSNHGDALGRQKGGSDSTVFYGTDNSCQSTDGHSHIMGKGTHIWVSGGCFSDMPIIVVKDTMCKAR